MSVSDEIFELKEDGNYWHWSLRYQWEIIDIPKHQRCSSAQTASQSINITHPVTSQSWWFLNFLCINSYRLWLSSICLQESQRHELKAWRSIASFAVQVPWLAQHGQHWYETSIVEHALRTLKRLFCHWQQSAEFWYWRCTIPTQKTLSKTVQPGGTKQDTMSMALNIR